MQALIADERHLGRTLPLLSGDCLWFEILLVKEAFEQTFLLILRAEVLKDDPDSLLHECLKLPVKSVDH